MKKHVIITVSDFLNYERSKEIHDNKKEGFELFDLVRIGDNRTGDANIFVFMGYTLEENRPCVLSNKSISSSSEEITMYNWGNDKFSLSSKSECEADSIFREPRVGDTVLCIAIDRYRAVAFNDTHKIQSICDKGRLQFEGINHSTYDSKYFIIVESSDFVAPGSRLTGSNKMHKGLPMRQLIQGKKILRRIKIEEPIRQRVVIKSKLINKVK